jgi:RNA polymerase sigma-70 factor (ECF subfamily)
MDRALTDEEQRIIILHVLWGYKHREIGKILDCPTGTVTSKYKRAIEKMRKALKEGV